MPLIIKNLDFAELAALAKEDSYVPQPPKRPQRTFSKKPPNQPAGITVSVVKGGSMISQFAISPARPHIPDEKVVKQILVNQEKRKAVFAALERVDGFLRNCRVYPGHFDQDMLDRGRTFVARSIRYLVDNEFVDDVPLFPYLSGADGYYQSVVDSLSKIGITTISDFFPFRRANDEMWRQFRLAWNRRVGSVVEPSFLVHLVM